MEHRVAAFIRRVRERHPLAVARDRGVPNPVPAAIVVEVERLERWFRGGG